MDRTRSLFLAGIAAAGLVAGHALAYLLAVPDGAHRHLLLAETGHTYLSSAAWLACLVGFVSLVVGVVQGYRGERLTLPAVFGRLALVQSVAFVVLETLERVAVGAPLSDLPTLLAIGIAVQVVVALAGAVVALGARRIGEIAAAALMAPRTPPADVFVPLDRELPATSSDRTDHPVRAPPLQLAA